MCKIEIMILKQEMHEANKMKSWQKVNNLTEVILIIKIQESTKFTVAEINYSKKKNELGKYNFS